jgi:FKBP-type peptidyl-prolyl cis-trans isomerase FkpA
MNKVIVVGLIVLIIIIVGIYFLIKDAGEKEDEDNGLNVYDAGGVKVEVLKKGSGVEAKKGDTVEVHYTGWLEDGEKFDSSVDKGDPFSFVIGAGQVIPGWDLGIEGIKTGEKRRLTIPPALAYGEGGVPGAIPGNAILIFEVELLKIK